MILQIGSATAQLQLTLNQLAHARHFTLPVGGIARRKREARLVESAIRKGNEVFTTDLTRAERNFVHLVKLSR
jgi:hypothetical protein